MRVVVKMYHVGRVIHLADDKVRYVTLEKFSDGDDLWISKHPGKDKFDAADVVARARRRLGYRGYDLIDWNCEHFATWCGFCLRRSRDFG